MSWAPTEPLSGVNTEKIIVINICDEGLSLAVPAYFPSKEILSPVLNFKQNLIELLSFSEVAKNVGSHVVGHNHHITNCIFYLF